MPKLKMLSAMLAALVGLPLLAQPLLAQGGAASPSSPQKQPQSPKAPPAAPEADTAAGTATDPAEPGPIKLKYPADREYVIAVVGERPVTLGELVDHIDERHHPGFAEALGKVPSVHRMLRSDLLAPWIRHYVDVKAFEFVTRNSEVDEKELEDAISARLKKDFEAWLARYVERRPANAQKLSQKAVNRLLADYQLRYGLAAEVQGWLDYFEPGEYTRLQLRNFFNANARAFGGKVDISHILVQHRDAGTGILLNDAGRGKANAKLADIKRRLRPDGSNFEEIARQLSDDTRSAKRGGRLDGVRRFDDRLPATLCRAAWELEDGQISDVVESQYGWHLVLRRAFSQHIFVLFTDDAIPSIEIVMRRSRQENVLFDARQRAKVQLKL
ncbi:MAG: peptidylprolyl isomerase [bacterium]|nr:peptidylprolyl isomerase [bacterium]